MRIWLLGLPFDLVDEDKALSDISQLYNGYSKDTDPRFVSSINTETLSKAISWTSIKDRDLLDQLRASDLSFAEGSFFNWLIKSLGCPLGVRIKLDQLLSKIFEWISLMQKKSFFLVSQKTESDRLIKFLKKNYPDFSIAGVSLKPIDINGIHLEKSKVADRELAADISAADPDFLFLMIGTPKQEIWYKRIKNYLSVPITFSFSRPYETRKSLGFPYLKVGWLAFSLLGFYKINQWVSSAVHTKSCLRKCYAPPQLFLSPVLTIVVFKIPCLLDRDMCDVILPQILEGMEQNVIVIDFSSLRHLDLYGCYLIFYIWQQAKKNDKRIIGFDLKGDIEVLMKANRLWDIIEKDLEQKSLSVLTKLGLENELFESLSQEKGVVTLSFFGILSANHDYDFKIDRLMPIIENKNLNLDFSYCIGIEDGALWYLIKLKEIQNVQKKEFTAVKIPKAIQEILTLRNLDYLFS